MSRQLERFRPNLFLIFIAGFAAALAVTTMLPAWPLGWSVSCSHRARWWSWLVT